MKRMIFVHLTVFALLFLSTNIQAQQNVSSDQLWQEKVSSQRSAVAAEPWIQPLNAKQFELDMSLMGSLLSAAPKEFSASARSTPQIISVPMPDGTFSRFTIEETQVMHAKLAAKFPDIKTYVGRGVDDPSASARFDWTPKGFHGQILKPSGAVYIDPAEKDNNRLYSSYRVKDYDYPDKKAWTCGVQSHATASRVEAALAGGGLTSGATLRTFRLAVSCTGEYAAFHGGTVALAQAAVVTTINRVNGIYESELAIRLQLVANNNLLMYTDAGSDPWDNNNDNAILNQASTTFNSVIGSGNYDVGHIVSTGAGGLAGLGVVCGSRKAEGVTGRANPVGDPYDVDFVAHEIGHQFNGDHTFNGDSGSCSGGNRNGPTAYEPGSGSTIQAYAGICANDDLQNNSDPYFHSESHAQIIGFVNGLGCGPSTATGNSPPSVEAGSNYIIPQSTPFELTGVGNDANGDTITYSWEQRDLGPQQDINGGDNGSSPLFRFWTPTTNPIRSFPRTSDLLNNTTVIGETLPTTSRTMNFRCTVRDNRAGGGGVSSDDAQVTVVSSAGPFLLTFPNTAVTLLGSQIITWNVAGTSGGAVNTPNVDLLLSTDGGLTFPTTLASAVPNSGSATVTLPNINSSTARIKVRGSENIFFDLSDSNFSIEPDNGLEITPLKQLNASGTQGGPFSPNCQSYSLKNNTGSGLNWQAGTDQSWATLSPTSGSIPEGGTVAVDVCISAAGNALPPGEYAATAIFTNQNNGATQNRMANLSVIPIGGRLQFSSATYTTIEGAAGASISVTRSGDTTGSVGLSYATANGSALQGNDYISKSGTLAWGHGDGATKTFAVQIIDDPILEGDETINLQLSSPTGGALLGTNSSAILTINDNDLNDTCGSARTIAGTPFTAIQNTGTATSAGDPTPSCVTNAGTGVWYQYTATTNAFFTIDTEGSDFDTVLTVFSGPCGSLNELNCNDDGGEGVTSKLTLLVTPGRTYRFLASGYNSAAGSLQMNASLILGAATNINNDVCTNAIPVSSTPFLNIQSTLTATAIGDPEVECSTTASNGVWYTYTAPRDGFLEVSLAGSDFDTALGIYAGSCGALNPIDCNDDDFGLLTSVTETFLSAGTTAYILCAGYDGEQGELNVFISFAGCDKGISDGDFEAGSPWLSWIQNSTFFSTPLDSSAPGGSSGPLSGSSWAWFYGPDETSAEVSTISQTVTLPAGAGITLRYQLWIGSVTNPLSDTLEIMVDGTILDTIDEPNTSEFFYSPEEVDISAYADGGNHTLQFRFTSPANGGFSDWNVDDIQIQICFPDFDGDGTPNVEDSDDDNDTIPDVWEDNNGLNSLDGSDAGLDIDGDGANGVEEYIADTSPTNNLSRLKLWVHPSANPDQKPLAFDSSSARDYFIQYRPSLIRGGWQSGPTNITGSGSTMNLIVTNPAPVLYFRLGAELP